MMVLFSALSGEKKPAAKVTPRHGPEGPVACWWSLYVCTLYVAPPAVYLVLLRYQHAERPGIRDAKSLHLLRRQDTQRPEREKATPASAV